MSQMEETEKEARPRARKRRRKMATSGWEKMVSGQAGRWQSGDTITEVFENINGRKGEGEGEGAVMGTDKCPRM